MGFFNARGPLGACAGLVPVSLCKGLTGLARCIQTSPTPPPPHPPSLSHFPSTLRLTGQVAPGCLYGLAATPPPLPPVPLLDHGADPQPQALIHRYTTRAGQVQLTQPQLQASIVFETRFLVRATGGLSLGIS